MRVRGIERPHPQLLTAVCSARGKDDLLSIRGENHGVKLLQIQIVWRHECESHFAHVGGRAVGAPEIAETDQGDHGGTGDGPRERLSKPATRRDLGRHAAHRVGRDGGDVRELQARFADVAEALLDVAIETAFEQSPQARRCVGRQRRPVEVLPQHRGEDV